MTDRLCSNQWRVAIPRGTSLNWHHSLIELSLSPRSEASTHAGLFARANSVNNNMRLYPKKILAREVRKYIRDQVQAKCALGELDHPSYCAPTFKHLNLVNISHQVCAPMACVSYSLSSA